MSVNQTAFSLITFASYWGSKFGGINAFNADLLEAVALAYIGKVNVICVVNEADEEEITQAKDLNVTLLPLPFKPDAAHMDGKHAEAAVKLLAEQNISFDANTTVWLGHDRITGAAAISAAKQTNGRSALIHHMSYEHYEAFAENSQAAEHKVEQQTALFEQADVLMAVGPLLRDALEDLIYEKDVHMLIPGLAKIEPRKKAPNNFSIFISGRLSPDAEKVKQGQLAIAAMGTAYKEAKINKQPDALLKRPKLMLRGVDFESGKNAEHFSSSEENLNAFSYKFAEAQLTIKALPYTTDREKLFAELKGATVAAMPSWHEGFGLVGWEAISAGVPLIVSKESGLYELIKRQLPELAQDDLWPVTIDGLNEAPYFSDDDLSTVSNAITAIANNPQKARDKALRLRDELLKFTWADCAESLADCFSWPIKRGQIDDKNISQPVENNNTQQVAQVISTIIGLDIATSNWSADAGMAPSVLLRANEAIVPFDENRADELDKLLSWAQGTPHNTNIRLITGDGGIGKTRLALELCHKLKNQNWLTGFLQKNTSAKLIDIWRKVQDADKNCLFVIDYAETRTKELLELLTIAQQAAQKSTQQNTQKSPHTICILLLARDGGEWWENLRNQDANLELLLISKATTGPYTLPPLYKNNDDKQRAYQNALLEFAKILSIQAPTIKPSLSGDYYSKPLYIQMSALLALHGEQAHSSDGITQGILNHEKRYWQAATSNINIETKTARNLLALVTLMGNIATPREAKKYWNLVDDIGISTSEFSQLFKSLIPLYPGYQGLQAVKPDLLGEELVAETLLTPIAPALLEAVLGKSASDRSRENALMVLARLTIKKPAVNEVIKAAFVEHLSYLVNHIVEVAVTTQSKLSELTVYALGHQSSNNSQHSIAKRFVSLIGDDSLALNTIACAAYGIIYHRLNDKYNLADEKGKVAKFNVAELGAIAFNYSLRLSYIGKNSEALYYAKQVMDIRNKLSNENLENQASKASSVNNYARLLGEDGQIFDAIGYAKQAMDVFCHLAEKDPAKYQASLANALGNYAIRLSAFGQYNEAIIYDKKAMAIQKKLAEQNPEKYQANYALTLNNYAISLDDLGEIKEALSYIEQSIKIRSQLAAKNPDQYQGVYADSLHNYANNLFSLGHIDAAIENIEKAMAIQLQLVEQNPERYETDYASLLSNYSNYLSDLGQGTAAIEYSEKSLNIHKSLMEKNPDLHQDSYSQLLNNRSIHLSYLGEYNKAIDYVTQAIELSSQLIEKNRDKYQNNYAVLLSNYAEYLNALGRYDEAISLYDKAKIIFIRTSYKIPLKHSVSLIQTELFIHFSNWLVNNKQIFNQVLYDDCINYIPEHEKNSIQLIAKFIQTLMAKEQLNCDEMFICFTAVIDKYAALNIPQQKASKDYWHCACLWVFTNNEGFSTATINHNKWLGEWNKFKSQRNNNLPQWMLDYAIKMQLTWP